MLAKNVNDNACFLIERGACEFFASKLAPTKSRNCMTNPAKWRGLYLNVQRQPVTNPLRNSG